MSRAVDFCPRQPTPCVGPELGTRGRWRLDQTGPTVHPQFVRLDGNGDYGPRDARGRSGPVRGMAVHCLNTSCPGGLPPGQCLS